MKILIIGGGNMGLTYANAFVRSHVSTREQLMILEHLQEKADQLAALGIAEVFLQADECLQKADVIILAVKPQDCAALFEQLRPHTASGQVFLSIMAGVKTETIQHLLGVKKVIRAMPNLPAQNGLGMTVYTASEEVTRLELAMVQNLLATTGKAVYVDDEKMIDAATAISGSGPAYVYFFMDALMKAAVEMGFNESVAELLVAQTFIGATDLYNKSDIRCQEWINRVASRGGTTEAALRSFESNQLHEAIVKGAFAALHRAEELGK